MISMDRKELVLAAMAPADGGWFTPVQVQKLFFLIDMNIGANVGGPHFAFTPYHYGPFDADVYREIEDLASRGMAEAYPNESFRMRKFCLTPSGQNEGKRILSKVPERERDYIERACKFVRETPFAQLVSSIYKAYPDMKVNSVFREPQ